MPQSHFGSNASFVQVEAGMTRRNTTHVAFHDLQQFLDGLGYVLFGIYDQTLEHDGQALLRYADPIFISQAELRAPQTPISLSSIRGTLPGGSCRQL